MDLLAIFILAFAVSLDGFIVGITYGLKKIKIGLLPILIISLSSGMTILASMTLGRLLASFLSPSGAEKIGGILLIFIGIWLLYQSIRELLHTNNDEDNQEDNPKEIFTFKIESLGLIINILKEPVKADFDYSGVISNKEALFLGVALALDAFGAGIAAAMTGYDSLLTAVSVSGFKFILLTGGIYLGKQIESLVFSDKIRLLPGIILILLGLSKLF
ncbi:sporulation membrane protein YtaF [Orenia metallireducens]|uniref:Sporulation membrane protein YtaF n=1 Tax=Orenia metallireducens TaxID=1413210 RepID=A0A1C0AB46_9FIRM|nr:sporulation membrane protein YtaF [Orenia metallireducens]OCL27564.1 sporulation membrane protein YtaF [Orenia metallireducens]